MFSVFTKSHAPVLSLFLISIFLSASLLFMVQPMAGKMLLPLVGGAPSGWIVALAFFQTALLAGYILAHLFSRLTPRFHGLAVFILLGLGFIFLPLDMSRGVNIDNSADTALHVFLLLVSAVAVPFIALSSVSSSLQRLFHNVPALDGRDPYFLYAVSNLGSFIGLLGYPFIIEPLFSLSVQTQFWSYGYILLMGGILLSSMSSRADAKQDFSQIIRPDLKTGLLWLALAFVPSSLMVGMTNYITLEVMPMPLFWVIPLALYLLTYIAAFSTNAARWVNIFSVFAPLAALLIIGMYAFSVFFMNWLSLFGHLACFTVIAMAAHMRLSSIKPHPEYLTSFYLYLALGGALGGIFNAFIAPEIFDKLYEYPLVAIFSLTLLPLFKTRVGRNVFYHPKPVFVLASTLFLLSVITVLKSGPVYMSRNFFGPISVVERTLTYKDTYYTLRRLHHGTTIHGLQAKELPLTAEMSYYGVLKPFFGRQAAQNIAVIGLGAGTVLCYTAPGRRFTAIEIDSEIADVARTYFRFIRECAHPDNRIIIGDGRIELLKLDERFDIIVLDAFSSDAIPSHLLTYEAFQGYRERLNENGIILLNISNRYFDLAGPVSTVAGKTGMKTWRRENVTEPEEPWLSPSVWLAISPDSAPYTDIFMQGGWLPVTPADTPLWTDDYTYVLSTLK